MTRPFHLWLGLLLAVPIAGYAAVVAEREYRLANAPVINVAIRGVDPRDLLRGRYLRGDFDWEWQQPAPAISGDGQDGRLCVRQSTGGVPTRHMVSFHGYDATLDEESCLAVIDGRYTPPSGQRPADFMPDGIALDHGAQLRLYVPERQAVRLEALLAGRPGSVSVDLVVRPDRTAAIRALRVNGVILGQE